MQFSSALCCILCVRMVRSTTPTEHVHSARTFAEDLHITKRAQLHDLMCVRLCSTNELGLCWRVVEGGGG